MTDWDTTALAALGGKPVSKAKAGPAPWEPLDLATLAPGFYLAADQSLDATGLVLLEVYGDLRPPRLTHAVKLSNTQPGLKKFEHMLAAAEEIRRGVSRMMDEWLIKPTTFAVHETPPSGGRMIKPESSLLASAAFRFAVEGLCVLPMIQANAHKTLITGDRAAGKPAVKAALERYVYPGLAGAALATNEAHRDGLCVALAAAKARRV